MVGITDENDGKILENTGDLYNEIATKYPSNNYAQLCNQFDVIYAQSQSILNRHLLDSKKAVKEVLNIWEDKGNATRAQLESALIEAETGALCSIVAKHFANGEAATGSGQAGRSERLSEQPCTQTQTGGTNTINNSGPGNVSGNNMIGQQTNNYNSAPSTPDVHHHHITNNVNQASPDKPVYIPHAAAPKRQANTIPGPAPKRAKVTASIPSTSKGTTSKPRKSATSTAQCKPKAQPPKKLPHATKKTAAHNVKASVPSTTKGTTSKPRKSTTSTTQSQRKPKAKPPKNLPHATKKPAAPKASGKKAPKTKNVSKAPKTKAPRKAKNVKVTQKKPPKAKQPKKQKSSSSGRVRPKKKSKK